MLQSGVYNSLIIFKATNIAFRGTDSANGLLHDLN